MSGPADFDVFVSYNRADGVLIEALSVRLAHEAGLRVWLDRDRLPAGTSWRAEIETALNGSASALIAWGPGGVGRVQAQERDLAYALRDDDPGFRVIYVLLPGAAPPRGSWANVDTWIRFESGLDESDAFAALVAALKGEAPPDRLAAKLPDTPAPYRGMDAFRVKDAPFFHGRGGYVGRMEEMLRHHPFVALIGPSGSGKTSLVMAGLLARLFPVREAGGGPDPWVVVRPGSRPLDALAAVLVRLRPAGPDSDTAAERLRERLRADPGCLSEVLSGLAPPEGRLVLVVDRLEEIFVHCEADDERRAFGRALAAAAGDPRRPAWIVATMRADFYAQLGRVPELADPVTRRQVYLKPLEDDEVAEVIAAPAAEVGAIFEKGLAARLLEESRAGGETSLPLLQHALDLLWRARRGRWLTWDTHKEIGGVSGALRYHAGRVVEALGPEARDTARRLLTRLVWLDETTGAVAGRRMEKEALLDQFAGRPEADRLLQHLASERLVVVRGEEGRSTVELIHDSLPVHWETLRGWLDHDREFLLWRQRLRNDQGEWVRSGHDRGGLLRGAFLAEGEQWLRERRSELNSEERAFVEASVGARDEEQRTRDRQRRWVVGGLAAGLLTAIVFLVSSMLQLKEVREQRSLAEARQLASRARSVRAETPALLPQSVLLAIESIRRRATLDGNEALRAGVALLPRPMDTLRFETAVRTLAFSPDGRSLLVGGGYHGRDGGSAVLWRLGAPGAPKPLPHEGWAVWDAAFSADGRLAATSGSDGRVRLWDAGTGAGRGGFPAGPSSESSIEIGPRGEWVLASGLGEGARVWEGGAVRPIVGVGDPGGLSTTAIDRGRRWLAEAVTRMAPDGASGTTEVHLDRLEPRGGTLAAAARWRKREPGLTARFAFSPDGRLLAMGSTEGVVVWETATGVEVLRARTTREVEHVEFRADGEWLAIGGADLVQVWQPTSRMLVSQILLPDVLQDLEFSPGGRMIATGTDDRVARVWDALTGEPLALASHGDYVTAVAFSADGRWVASGSEDGEVRVWEAPVEKADSGLRPDDRRVRAVSADGSTFVSLQRDTLVVWDVATERPVARVPWAGQPPEFLLSADGRWIATSKDRHVRVWNARDERLHRELDAGDTVSSIAFGDGGGWLAAVAGKRAHVWEVASGEKAGVVPIPVTDPEDLALSPDGGSIAVRTSETAVWIGEVERGRRTRTIPLPAYAVMERFTPDGGALAVSGGAEPEGSREVVLWPTRGEGRGQRLPHPSGVGSIEFSADGRRAVTTSGGAVYLWRIGNAQPRVFRQDDSVVVARLSPDERWLLTVGRTSARVLELPDGREAARVTLPLGLLSTAQFGAGGERIIIRFGGLFEADEMMRIVPWKTDDLVRDACSRLGRNFTAGEWSLYFGAERCRATCPGLPACEPSRQRRTEPPR